MYQCLMLIFCVGAVKTLTEVTIRPNGLCYKYIINHLKIRSHAYWTMLKQHAES